MGRKRLFCGEEFLQSPLFMILKYKESHVVGIIVVEI